MLSENLKALRKRKGYSQEELAAKLNVVRQTISKWEKGLSVPDSEMLIRLAEELDSSVSEILGEKLPEKENDNTELQVIAAKLELLNEQFARQVVAQNERRRRTWHAVWLIVGGVSLCSIVVSVIFSIQKFLQIQNGLSIIGGADGPTAIMVARSVPDGSISIVSVILLAAAIIGIWQTRKRS